MLILAASEEIWVLQSLKCSPQKLALQKNKSLISIFIKTVLKSSPILKISVVKEIKEDTLLIDESSDVILNPVPSCIEPGEEIKVIPDKEQSAPPKLECGKLEENEANSSTETKSAIEANSSAETSYEVSLENSEETISFTNEFPAETPITPIIANKNAEKKIINVEEPQLNLPDCDSQKENESHKKNELDSLEPPVSRIKQNYLNFITYLNSEDSRKNRPQIKGWDFQNKNYYFVQSCDSKQYAVYFLSQFWKEPGNKALTIEEHLRKICEIRPYKDADEISFSPSCIAFMVVMKGSKSYCFIAPSFGRETSTKLLDALTKTVCLINQQNETIEFVLLGGKISYFNEILRNMTGENYKSKGCSEKYYVEILTKFYMHLGSLVEVKGISSCSFFPYQQNTAYGDRSDDPVNATVRPFSNRIEKIKIDNKTYVASMRLCPSCEINKPI